MTDVLFTSYAFPATNAPSPSGNRTMPVRYNDIINVKDWGAKGDGVTDDGPSINAAVAYAYSLGTAPQNGLIVFLPPGTYFVDPSSAPIDLNNNVGSQQGCLQFIGAGRDATKITSTYTGGFLVIKRPPGNNVDNINRVADMTIENLSQTAATGGLQIHAISNTFNLENCNAQAL